MHDGSGAKPCTCTAKPQATRTGRERNSSALGGAHTHAEKAEEERDEHTQRNTNAAAAGAREQQRKQQIGVTEGKVEIGHGWARSLLRLGSGGTTDKEGRCVWLPGRIGVKQAGKKLAIEMQQEQHARRRQGWPARTAHDVSVFSRGQREHGPDNKAERCGQTASPPPAVHEQRRAECWPWTPLMLQQVTRDPGGMPANGGAAGGALGKPRRSKKLEAQQEQHRRRHRRKLANNTSCEATGF